MRSKRPKMMITAELRRALCLGLVLLLCLGASACARQGGSAPTPATATPTARPTETPSPPPEPTPTPRGTPEDALSIAIPPAAGAWGPFDAASGGDKTVQRLTQTPLLARGADGSFPESPEGVGAAGVRVTLRGDGSTVLRLHMREDIRFADGSYADALDLLFTLYFLLDPSYEGQLRLRDCAITGLTEYRCRCSSALLETYSLLYDEPGEEYAPLREECLRLMWDRELRALTALCREEYLETYAPFALGLEAEEALLEEGNLRVFAMWCAGLAENADDYGYVRDTLGRSWNPSAGILPDEEALYEVFSLSYPGPEAFDRALGRSVDPLAREEFIRRCAALDPENTDAPKTVSGIRPVDDYTVELSLDRFSREDLERLGSLFLASLRACGDESLYLPEEGLFGFPYGETELLRSRSAPGAGPYTLGESEETGLRLAANENYYPGAPAIGELWLLAAPEGELLTLVKEGQADLVYLPGSAALLEEAGSLPQLTLRSVASDVYGWLEFAPAAFGEDETWSLMLREAVLGVVGACCRASAKEYFGGAALVLGPEEDPEEALEAAKELLSGLPEDLAPELNVLLSAGGSGAHPCWAGLQEAARLLEEAGVTLTVKDALDDASFWAAVDGGEADLWCAASHEGKPPAPDGTLTETRLALYRRLDALLVNNERLDILTLPVELTWVRDHLSVIETLALR